MPKTNAPTSWRGARSRRCGRQAAELAALGLGRHGLLLDLLFIDQIEVLARAVAGIVALRQAPHLRLAGAAEIEDAAHLAGHALLDLGDAESDLAADLHVAGRDALDDAVDRRPVALGTGRHAVDAALHGPEVALFGDRDVAGLGALDLGVPSPHDLARVGEELGLGLRGDLGAVDLGRAGRQRRAEAGERRTLLDRGRLRRRRRRIEGGWRLRRLGENGRRRKERGDHEGDRRWDSVHSCGSYISDGTDATACRRPAGRPAPAAAYRPAAKPAARRAGQLARAAPRPNPAARDAAPC